MIFDNVILRLDCECLQFFPANQHSTIASYLIILLSPHEECSSLDQVAAHHHVLS